MEMKIAKHAGFRCAGFGRQHLRLGVAVGWDTADKTTCWLLQLGFWVVIIGPHAANQQLG